MDKNDRWNHLKPRDLDDATKTFTGDATKEFAGNAPPKNSCIATSNDAQLAENVILATPG